MDFNSVSSALVRLSLDAALMNHNAISNNIANANTPGYKPLGVSFATELTAQKEIFMNRARDEQSREILNNLKPELQQLDVTPSAKIALDMEMVKMNKNTLHYRALLEGLSKNMSIIKMAIREGR